jgi:superfamily II DNA or RNA helicase
MHAGIQFYSVFWRGPAGTKTVAEQDLVAFAESPSPTACLVSGQILGYQEFQRVITYHRLHREHPLRNNIFAFNASRTRFFPYQFKPLVKFLDSPGHRLLVCDEVGLGKTIEAGLILVEMRARQDVSTALVVCPAGLREKWKLELRRRFGEDFRILSAKDVKDFLDEYEETPDRITLNGITSYETLRSPTILARLEDMLPSLDLVIADEAHHMRNFGVRTRRAGVALAANAGAVILLTATPVHLGDENLFSLLNLLDEEDFPDLGLARQRFQQNEPLVRAQRLLTRVPPAAKEALDALREAAKSPWLQQAPSLSRVMSSLEELAGERLTAPAARPLQLAVQSELADLNLLSHIFTRTRKRDVQTDVAQRRAYALEITFTQPEREFYDAVTAFVRAKAAAGDQLPIVLQWQLNSIQRRASSSIHAMVHFYRTRPVEQGLDVGEDDILDEQVEDAMAQRELLRASAELARIVHSWPEDAADSKYDEVHKFLGQLRSERVDYKLVVFAFFRETLYYLQRRLTQNGIGVALLLGDVPADERPAIIELFRSDPDVHVLLSSRVGSEGLDFQFCDTMVNYDLPWNPMEVEQRIGRLDRIGQRAAVIRIINLWTLDTIEERILRRLYGRLGVFERSIGALDAVLGDVMRRLERESLSRDLSPEEARKEADRVALVLVKQSEDSERLESETARFIGADEYFSEEVAAIQANRRYVTGEQLRRFILDFIRVHASGTKLRYDHEANRGTIVPDAVLRKFLKSQKGVGDLIRFLSAGPEGLEITFDSQVAFEEPSIEFINVLHPLVTAIVDSYNLVVGERMSAQHLMLRTARLSPGMYVFVVYRLSVHGAQTRHTMECVLLGDELEPACDGDKAEAILGEMVELGEEPTGGSLMLEPYAAQLAVARAEEIFVTRQQVLRSQLEAENNGFVERRIASLQQSYTKNIERVRIRLERAREGAKQERYQRMLRGQIARMESERDAKLGRLNDLRVVQVEHQEITAGILEVVSA